MDLQLDFWVCNQIMQYLRGCVDYNLSKESWKLCSRYLTAENCVRFQDSTYGIWGGQSGTGTGLSPFTSILYQYFSNASYSYFIKLSPTLLCKWQKRYVKHWKESTVDPSYKDIGLYDTSPVKAYILWNQLLRHC
jgi:hypothetical protein